jgi:nicotinate-nucleotide pyrophosphorylase (carboxylating)
LARALVRIMCVVEFSLKTSADFSPQVDRLIELALEEDIGRGDATTQALIPPEKKGAAQIRAKEPLVAAGLPVAARVFMKLDREVHFLPMVEEGQEVEAGQVLAQLRGPVASILTGERVALNFLMRLSGIATYTRQAAAAVKDFPVAVVDTRKTTPGWRVLEKYAVKVGGAQNHRFGLYDGVLIKNNHLAAVGGISEAVGRARKKTHQLLKIEVEVTDLKGVEEALAAGADIIMLDNMEDAALAAAVQLTQGRALLEASGGMTMERLPRVAAAGVNFISMGTLTHSAPAVDIHLRLM